MAVKPTVTCYTDGSTCGNPGRGGWGAILIRGDRVRAVYGTLTRATSNQAEVAAVINALRALSRPCRVHVFTDSKYVIFGILRVIKAIKRGDNSILLGTNNSLWLEMLDLMRVHTVTATHISGHSVYEYNELADSIASLGSREGREGSFYVHELSETCPETKLIQTVKKRVEKRKDRIEKKLNRLEN